MWCNIALFLWIVVYDGIKMVEGATTAPVILFQQGRTKTAFWEAESFLDPVLDSGSCIWEYRAGVPGHDTTWRERGGIAKATTSPLVHLFVTRSHVPPVGLILPLFSTPFRHLLIKSSLFAQKLQTILRKHDCTRYKRDFPTWDQL